MVRPQGTRSLPHGLLRGRSRCVIPFCAAAAKGKEVAGIDVTGEQLLNEAAIVCDIGAPTVSFGAVLNIRAASANSDLGGKHASVILGSAVPDTVPAAHTAAATAGPTLSLQKLFKRFALLQPPEAIAA